MSLDPTEIRPAYTPPLQETLDPATQSLAQALNLSFKILQGIMILLVILFLSSGIFVVEQNQEAMVLRFGQIQGSLADRILKPGLHYSFPYPLSQVIKIPTHEIKLHDGDLEIMNDFWYEDDPKIQKVQPTLDPELEGYLLTGDVNIIHAQWQLRYIISDSYSYYVKWNNAEELLRHIICNCMVKATAGCKIPDDAVLGNLIDKIAPEVKEMAQEQLDSLQTGIKIQGLALVHIVPPRQVKDVFDSVLKAKTEQDRQIAEARNYSEQIIARATGEKAELLAKAQNYALQICKETESDARYFENLLAQQHHHGIFQEQQYQLTIENLNRKIQEIFLYANQIPDRELRLQLNRNPDLYRIQAPKED